MQNANQGLFRSGRFRCGLAAAALAVSLTASGAGLADDALESLITDTPEEGFALAIKLSQKAVGTTQPDSEVRRELRQDYAYDANSLIHVSHVVAVHFRTVAEANDYWRED